MVVALPPMAVLISNLHLLSEFYLYRFASRLQNGCEEKTNIYC